MFFNIPFPQIHQKGRYPVQASYIGSLSSLWIQEDICGYLQWESDPVSPRHLFLDRMNHLLEACLSLLTTDGAQTETRHLIFLCQRLNEGSPTLNHSIIMFQSKQFVAISSWCKADTLSHKDN